MKILGATLISFYFFFLQYIETNKKSFIKYNYTGTWLDDDDDEEEESGRKKKVSSKDLVYFDAQL